jgi:serine/threonine protein phosphatase 1
MIFAISDVHAHYDAMKKRIDQIRPFLDKGDSRLIMLGDFIDRGPASYECLQLAFDLQKEYGADKVVALRGNHEEWFLDFLFHVDDVWLAEDHNYRTSGTFLSDDQKEKLSRMHIRDEILSYLRDCIKKNHKELISWLKKLPYFYETETQIFVHAGVDEEIPEEELDYCTIGTSDDVFTGKYPPSTGHFFKDIIAGHVAASHLAHDKSFSGIYFDGQSHFYIDGSTTRTKRVLCLVYEEAEKIYYELKDDGSLKRL